LQRAKRFPKIIEEECCGYRGPGKSAETAPELNRVLMGNSKPLGKEPPERTKEGI
jgi:hypothetical protein